MNPLIGYLRTRGLQRGVFGGSRTWLGVWVGLTAVRFLTKLLSQPDQVERVALKRGEVIEIRDTGVTWHDERKERKARKRNEKGK